MKRMFVLSAGLVLALACSKKSEEGAKKSATLTSASYGLKVAGLYDLATSQRDLERPGSKVFIIVTDKDVRIGAQWNRAEIGKPFPGTSIAQDKLFAWLDKRAPLPRTDEDDEKESAEDDMYSDGKIGPAPHARPARPPGPLLLADKNLAATRLSQVLASLCHYGGELAVADPANDIPRAHKVRLRTYEDKRCKAQKSVGMSGGSGGSPPTALPWALALHLEKNRTTLYMSDKATRNVERKPGVLSKAIRAARLSRGVEDPVFMTVSAGVTVADLVAALDELALKQVGHVHLGTNWARAQKAANARNLAAAAILRKLPQMHLPPLNNVGLDGAIIRRRILRRSYRLKRCFAQPGPGGHRSKGGTIKTSFTIKPIGRLEQVTATGDDVRISKCVAGVIRGIGVPERKGGGPVKVTKYPITFTFRK